MRETSMKIIVLGAAGMLGHLVGLFLREKYGARVVLSGRAKSGAALIDDGLRVLDLTDANAVKDMIAEHRPCVIVNCAAVNDGSRGAEELEAINTHLPLMIASILDEKKDGSRLIHISTDGVFRGDRGGYGENDQPDADDPYGKSKQAGEVTHNPHLTVRTSIIGPDPFKPRGLFNWCMSQSGEVKGYSRVFWNGVTTLELARFIDFAIKNNIIGLCHLSSSRISKYDLLVMIKEAFVKDIVIKRDESQIFDRSLISDRKDFSYQVPAMQGMMEELKAWMSKHLDVYKNVISSR